MKTMTDQLKIDHPEALFTNQNEIRQSETHLNNTRISLGWFGIPLDTSKRIWNNFCLIRLERTRVKFYM